MQHSSSVKRTRTFRPLTVSLAVPLALFGLLLTGCSGSDEPASRSGQTSQEGGAASGGEDSSDGTDEAVAGDQADEEGEGGDFKVSTKIPDEFPDDMPLPEKAPTSVVTVGTGGGTVGGGWALNYDGVTKEEVLQVLQEAKTAGYSVGGPFGSGSSDRWMLRKGTTAVIVLFSEGANLNITVTKAA